MYSNGMYCVFLIFFLEPVSFKVVVIGGGYVGRLCFFERYCFNKFEGDHIQMGE